MTLERWQHHFVIFILVGLLVKSHLRSNEARSGSGSLQCKASPDGFRSHQRLQVDCHKDSIPYSSSIKNYI